MNRLFSLLFSLFFLPSVFSAALDDAPSFATAEQHNQYNHLIAIIRCPTCQNQNIAESNAPLARQLRQIIIEQIQAGESNNAITTYLTDRYGDFITYDPPFKPSTWALWLSPIIIMFLALILWLNWRNKTHRQSLSPKERQQLYTLIQQYSEKS